MRVVSQAVLRRRFSSSRRVAGLGGADPAHAPVARVDLAGQQAVGLELGHHLGDRGRGDPLVLGQLAEGEGPVEVDRVERRQLARGEPAGGLLAQPPGQAGGAEAEPGRDLGRVDLEARGSGCPGHGPETTNSYPN